MKPRRPFVPAAPNFSALEGRIAPSNLFGLGTWWDHRMADLGFEHYKHHGAKTSDVGKVEPAGETAVAKQNHASAKVPAVTANLFK